MTVSGETERLPAAVFHGSCISEQVKWETDKGRHKRNNRHKEEKKYNIVK